MLLTNRAGAQGFMGTQKVKFELEEGNRAKTRTTKMRIMNSISGHIKEKTYIKKK